MKNLLLVPALMLPFNGSQEIKRLPVYEIQPPTLIVTTIDPINGKIDNREELIEAMAFVESGGNPEVIGDLDLDAPSVGLLQIRPIMVREVNRILKNQGSEKRFRNRDRKNAESSIEMFNIWANAYHIDSSYEKMARNWNGGPNGYKKSSTAHYWVKVSNYVNQNL